MRRSLLALALLLSACADDTTAELAAVKRARTAAAEWALVNRLAQRGELIPAYVSGMRRAARDELLGSVRDIPTASPEQPIVLGLLAEPPQAAPDRLEAGSERLKTIETALESA